MSEPMWTDERIAKRSRELWDMGMHAIDVGKIIAEEVRDDLQARITELEAQLAAASQWQPLPDGEYSVDGVNPSYRLRVSGGNLAAGWARSVNMDEIFIGEYRLFRRTPAAGADHAS